MKVAAERVGQADDRGERAQRAAQASRSTSSPRQPAVQRANIAAAAARSPAPSVGRTESLEERDRQQREHTPRIARSITKSRVGLSQTSLPGGGACSQGE